MGVDRQHMGIPRLLLEHIKGNLAVGARLVGNQERFFGKALLVRKLLHRAPDLVQRTARTSPHDKLDSLLGHPWRRHRQAGAQQPQSTQPDRPT